MVADTAAIILCAGKGTRMGSAEVNKVAFDCAGVPVIRRIVRNMRAGGIDRFVIVVGYRAESVMRALDGEDGVLFAYQAQQKGTGHAAGCGLKVLEDIGFSGKVVISMGDKIVPPEMIGGLLAASGASMATLGVQKRPAGPTSKGHVVIKDGRAFGIVEAKDVQQALAEHRTISLCGQTFAAEDVAATSFVNAAVYCFEAGALNAELKTLRADNVQGEIYLTDTIERFASRSQLAVYMVEEPSRILTYSTKRELREIVWRYLPRENGRPYLVASAPGRVNLMGRHIEHRGGSTNMMATEQRVVFKVFPRADRIVHAENANPEFPAAEFDLQPFDLHGGTADWLDYLERPDVKASAEQMRGHWVNYIKGAVYRFQALTSLPLCGMDIQVSGNIPMAAGISSSSALVVATAEAVVALNALSLSVRDFVDLCGEAEWFVGTRGGAGDHAAIKCSSEGAVTHLKFNPFSIGETVDFPAGYSVIVVQSGETAKKSEGARDVFNSRIRDYETAFAEVRRHYPEFPIACFRDIAFLPVQDREKALGCLAGSVRGVATFGVRECLRSERCVELLKAGDMVALGALMKESHDGDRIGMGEYECSTPRIDALCDRLNAADGVLGSELVGAGLGGCVIALVRDAAVESVLSSLAADGYSAFVSHPSSGSRVDYV